MSDPAPAAPETRRFWQQPLWQAVATAALAFVILVARRPEAFSTPQFWAEDGPVFFNQADGLGLQALPLPYAGYRHTLIRLVAGLANPLPALWIPAAYVWACVAIMLGVIVGLFSPRITLPAKPVLGLALVLIPQSGEALGNLTNSQWVSALGLVWLLLAKDPSSLRQHITDTLVAVVVGLTGIFSTLFIPLFAWRAWQRRTVAAGWLALIVILAGVSQAWVFLHSSQPPVPPGAAQIALTDIIQISGLRLPLSLWLHPALAAGLPRTVMLFAGLLALTLLGVAAAARGIHRTERIVLVGALIAVLAATLFRFRFVDFVSLYVPAQGDRYFYLPKVLAVWLLAMGLASAGWRRWTSTILLSGVVVVTTFTWRLEALKDFNWPYYARRIQSGAHVPDIPINPGGMLFTYPGKPSGR